MIIRLAECFVCSCSTGSPELCVLDTGTVKHEVYKCSLYSMLTTRTPQVPALRLTALTQTLLTGWEECATHFLAAKWVFLKCCFLLWRTKVISTPKSCTFWEVITFKTSEKIHFLCCDILELSFEGISFEKKTRRGIFY